MRWSKASNRLRATWREAGVARAPVFEPASRRYGAFESLSGRKRPCDGRRDGHRLRLAEHHRYVGPAEIPERAAVIRRLVSPSLRSTLAASDHNVDPPRIAGDVIVSDSERDRRAELTNSRRPVMRQTLETIRARRGKE